MRKQRGQVACSDHTPVKEQNHFKKFFLRTKTEKKKYRTSDLSIKSHVCLIFQYYLFSYLIGLFKP